MSKVLTPALELSERRILRRVRELPLSGEVLVKEGELVSQETKVLRAQLPGELLILRLAERMGLQVFEVLENLCVKEGDTVSKGDLLCTYSSFFGLLNNRYMSPEGGTVEFISKTGHIGLRLPSTELTIDAYLSGKIIFVEAGRSVTIESDVCFMQGIFGIGGEQCGRLRLLECDENTELTSTHIPKDCEGDILVGGMHADISALRAAEERGAKGLVTASLDDRALKEFLGYDLGVAITGDEDVSMSLLVTEGFGSISMSQRITDLLRPHEGSLASINGATQVRAGARRPELIIPLGEKADTYTLKEHVELELNVGSKVRLIRVPYFGHIAEVIELPSEAQEIETGAKTRVLRARLDDGTEVVVPRANIELVA